MFLGSRIPKQQHVPTLELRFQDKVRSFTGEWTWAAKCTRPQNCAKAHFFCNRKKLTALNTRALGVWPCFPFNQSTASRKTARMKVKIPQYFKCSKCSFFGLLPNGWRRLKVFNVPVPTPLKFQSHQPHWWNGLWKHDMSTIVCPLSHSSKHVRRRFKEFHEKFLGTKHPRRDAEKLPRLWASWLGTWLTWSISSGSLLLGFFKLRPAMLLKQRQGRCSGWIQAFVNVSFWPLHSHTKMTEPWRGFWLYIWFPCKSLCRRLATYALQLNFQGQTPPKKRQKIWALKPAGCKAFP